MIGGKLSNRSVPGIVPDSERRRCVCDAPRWMMLPFCGSKKGGRVIACATCKAQFRAKANYTETLPKAPVNWPAMSDAALFAVVPVFNRAMIATAGHHPYMRGE